MLTAVIVTYANRWNYLSCILTELEDDKHVSSIVVIDNSSSYNVREECLKRHFTKTEVYRNEINLGSAGGFSIGIEIAMLKHSDLVLLLDDDNLPQKNAIEKMLTAYNILADNEKCSDFAVAGFRECQHGKSVVFKSPLFLAGHDFLGFNVFNALIRHTKKSGLEAKISSGPDYVKFNKGNPYGGMLLSKQLIEKIGYPDKSFVLYFDDIEYTSRILKNGGIVWLQTDSLIVDIETNCSMSIFSPPIIGVVNASSDSKIYYIFRNRIYIDTFIDNTSSMFYFINKYLLFMLVALLCVFKLKLSRVSVLFDAYRDGNSGKLGFNGKYKF